MAITTGVLRDGSPTVPTRMNEKPVAYSVIVPVYGDGVALPELFDRLSLMFTERSMASWELILVNDGSPRHCWASICKLVAENSGVRAIDLMRNYGQHNALLCGIRACLGEIVVTMDDDLQHPPEEVPALLDKLERGYDVVYGVPNRQQHGFLRDAASYLTKLALQSAMGVDVARNVSAFRVFRTELRMAFASFENPFVSIDVLLTWATTHFATVVVRHDARKQGKSNYTLRMLLRHALNMMTGFSTFPLQIASLVGFTFTVFGLIVLFYVLLRYLVSGNTVPGFPFLASIIAIFSGAQLFALGILGEYIARIHSGTMDRPPYAIREVRSKDTVRQS